MKTFEIVELQKDGKEKTHGVFDFHIPPRAGDRVEFGHSGVFDLFEVTWVLHRPLRTVPENEAEESYNRDNAAASKVYVRWLVEQ